MEYLSKHNMRKLVRFLQLLVMATMLIGARGVWASCTLNITSGNLPYYDATLTNFSPPPFDPTQFTTGQIIYSATGTANINNSTNATFACTVQSDPVMGQGMGTPVNNIYPTTIPGIGVRIRNGTSEPPQYFPGQSGTIGHSSGVRLTWQFTIDIIKTGDVTTAGTLTGPYLQFYGDGQLLIQFSWTVKVQPVVPTCTVQTPSLTIPMGTTMTTAFAGKGTTAGNTAGFNIQLACAGGSTGTSVGVYATLSDATTPGNTSNVLSLSSDSTAQGVGIQVYNNGVPVSYGPDSATIGNTNQWLSGTVAQGVSSYSIPLTARYIQTGGTVTAGTANAVATVTMGYQ